MSKCVWALESEEITEHLCKMQAHEAKGWLAEVIASLSHPVLTRVVVTLWRYGTRGGELFMKIYSGARCLHTSSWNVLCQNWSF